MREDASMTQQTIKASLNEGADGHTLLSFEMKSGTYSLDLDDENTESKSKTSSHTF